MVILQCVRTGGSLTISWAQRAWQVQYLLDAGRTEIAALEEMVLLLSAQLQRVVASKDASLAVNSGASCGQGRGADIEANGHVMEPDPLAEDGMTRSSLGWRWSSERAAANATFLS